MAASAEAVDGRVAVRAAVVPTVERRFLGSEAEVAEGVARVEVDLARPPAAAVPVAVLVVVVLGAVEVAVAGLRAVVDEAVALVAVLLARGLEAVEAMLLVRREVALAVGFFSSSLALTLGRLRWLVTDDVEPGAARRAAVVDVVGGRVGGLLRPPAARDEAVELAAVREAVVEVAAAGRRAVVVVGAPGRLAAVADVADRTVPFVLEGVAGADGVSGVAGAAAAAGSSLGTSELSAAAAASSSATATGEEAVEFSSGASVVASTGVLGTSSAWETSAFSISDMVAVDIAGDGRV